MRNHIITQLKKLEEERAIKILYAVESGSRAWGFASENSDWDVRFIYVHTLDWYLQIGNPKDSIEQMLPNDLDLSGWELRKALNLFRKSNPSLLEWLGSPIVYMEKEAIINEWRNLGQYFFNPKNVMYHYLNMARNTYNNYLNQDMLSLKKYFYALRPLLACEWIETNGTMPPTLFLELLNSFDDPEIELIIQELLIEKQSSQELGQRPQIPVLNHFILTKIDYYSAFLKGFKVEQKQDTSLLNDFFRSIVQQ